MKNGKMIRSLLFLLLTLTLCLRAAAKDSVGEKEAAAVILDEQEKVIYQPDGTGERTDDLRVLIRNDRGLREFRQLSLTFSENYEKLTLEKLEVKKADGKVVSLDPAVVSRIVTDHSGMGSRIFDPAWKQLQVTVPQLAVGDEVFFRFREKVFKARCPDQWCGISVLQGEFPIRRSQYSIDAPAEKPLKKIFVKNEVEGTLRFSEEKKGDRILYCWTAENVPPVTPEPAMPALWRCSQRVAVSTVERWEDISRWYFDLCEKPIAAITPEMQQKTAELIQGKKTPEEKMRAIFQFVSQKINYTGLTEESVSPGYEPHPVSRTFERQNGVCRDKAALLVAMLRGAGFPAYMVLFQAGDVKDEEVPNFYFNHAIVALELKKGEYLLMDPTDETTRDFLPAYERNKSFLVAKEKGDTIRRSPSASAEENLLRLSLDGKWNKNGFFSGKIVLDCFGIYDVLYRSFLAEASAEEARLLFASRIRQYIPDCELHALKITPEDRQDTSRPIHIELEIRKTNFSPLMLEVVPILSQELSPAFGVQKKFLDLSLSKRRFPLKTRPLTVLSQYRIEFPDSLKIIALPPPQKFILPGKFSIERQIFQENNTVLRDYRYVINTDELSPEDYAVIRQNFNVLRPDANATPLGKLDFSGNEREITAEHFPGEDSALISDEKEIFLGREQGSWEEISKVRRKLFTYAAASAHSTLSIPYFPDYDSVDISGMTVTPDGKEIPLSPTEIRDMDAPDNGKVGQYPVHKIKVAVFSRVTPGSEIRYTLKIKRSKRRSFDDRMIVGGKDPILKQTLTLHIPKGKRLHHAVNSRYFAPRWEMKKEERVCFLSLPPLPSIAQEIQQPPFEDFLPAFRFSDFDYREYGQTLDKQLREKAKQDPGTVRALAQKLTASCQNDREKAIALRDFVSRSIADAGPSLRKLPGVHFHTPAETLAYGSGNSADRAILLAALCDAAGLKWRFVALSEEMGLPAKQAQLIRVPRDIFDAVLLYLPDLSCYLNDTGNFAELGTLHHDGNIALEADSGHLMTCRAELPCRNGEKRNFHIRFRPNGDALVSARIQYSGKKAESFRSFFATANPIEQRQYAEQLCFSQFPGAILRSVTADCRKYPVEFFMEYEISHFTTKAGNYFTCTLPGFSDYRKKFLTTSRTRITPCRNEEPFELQQDYTLEYPDDFIPLPQREAMTKIGNINGVFYLEHFFSGKNSISLKTKLLFPAIEIPPEEYDVLKHLNSFFAEVSSNSILFQKGE